MTGSPYKGLAAFDDSERDVALFFGRDGETGVICANLMASRLTVLYGETGVGKSSVLRAGVVHEMRRTAGAHAVVVFDNWKDDPAAGLNAAVSDATGVEPGRTLADTLEAGAAQLGGDVFVVLDGFEEYFLYHEDEEGAGTFLEEFPEAIRRRGLRASFLVALREDSLARIDRFKASIPGLFANYLRLDHLDRAAARDAIVRPVDRYNELVELDAQVLIEPALVDAVLDEVVAGRVDLGQAGRGVVESQDTDDRIEAPYLQLVMQRLWEAETETGSRVLRASTLKELGGAQEIVRAHLKRALDSLTSDQKDAASAVFNHLVTPSGTKIAHAVPDLARYAGVTESDLDPMLATLARERILRTAAANGVAPRYEIYHDVLGDAVLAWRAGHETERELAGERRAAARRHRRLLAALAAGGVLVAVMAGVTVFALTQRSEARMQANKAQARTLEGEALSLFETDPELSLILASEAARKSPSPQVERTLRNAYSLSRERAVFPTHGAVSAAMYSTDGKFVVVASKDGSTRVFDARTRERVLSVNHGAPVTRADLSSDDTRLVTAGEDGRARIWDAVTGKPLGSVRHGSPVRTAAFDPAGSLVVTTGDRVAKIWSAHGQPVAVLPWDKPVTAASFSPGGGLVVVVGNESIARVYDGSTGRLVRSLDQGGRVTSAKFSLGGDLLMTTGANETARVWRVRDGKLLRELKGHRGAVLDAAFSPGGWRVATASADGTGRIWDVRTGGTVASILGHGGIVDAVAFSPDGNFVVTGSTDGTARVSKADNGSGRVLLAGHDDSVHTVAFSPDGSRVLTVSDDGTARLWDPAAQTHLELVRRARGPLEEAEYVGEGGRILVAGPDRQALILRAADGRVVESIPAKGSVTAVAASPDGTLFAVAGGRPLLLQHQDGRTTHLVHPDKVTSVAFSPDGGRVVTGGRRGTARIWSVDGEQLVQLRGHTGEITDVAFSPDGNRVATSSRDATARTWDATTGRSLQSFTGHRDDVNSVAFSADGRLLLTASRDHDGRLWDVETGTVKQVLRAHYGEVAEASFSPDGRWILTAGPAAAYLWQQGVRDPVLSPGFGGHQSRLTSAVFDPSSRFVLTASTDGTVRRAECLVCRDLDGMLDLARLQLAETRRTLTQAERERYGLD